MNKSILGIVAVVVVIAAAVFYFRSYGGASNSSPQNGAAPTVGSQATGGNAVSISNFSFSPAALTVKVGDKVTFTNNDSVGHSVVADDGSFDTGIIAQGQSQTVTFAKAGTFNYHCSVHPSMKASVTVQ